MTIVITSLLKGTINPLTAQRRSDRQLLTLIKVQCHVNK